MTVKKQKLGRWALLLLIIGVLFFILSGKEGLIKLYQQHRQEIALKHEIIRLHETIDSLKVENQQLRSDTVYIERIARERLGMARKDETVYKFIDQRKPQ